MERLFAIDLLNQIITSVIKLDDDKVAGVVVEPLCEVRGILLNVFSRDQSTFVSA